MSKGAITFNEKNIEYYTPKKIVDMFGSFDYDPATTKEQAEYLSIKNYDTKETDGLKQDWNFNRVWINPPFDIKHIFFQKAVEEYKKYKNEIYFLCPIEFITTKRFRKVAKEVGVKIYFPNGRIKFISGVGLPEKSPAFGSVVIKIQEKNEIEFLELL